ncbi:MAG TPA: cyclic pyranopterin monophosphate synthase MoaC [Anaerolineae bacterium]|nr:cyclic pyranopterin monophosphate synthase MoaC [Anaerolineae bacterium]
MSKSLTHLDEHGHARMVDVGGKADTKRVAIARGEVHLSHATIDLILSHTAPKGDVFAAARLAGIMAAKKTSELIPLCHPLSLTHLSVDLKGHLATGIVEITAQAETTGKTGVEMEALTAVSVAALTVYDMIKAVQRDARIMNVRLIEKHGGKSGDIVLE